MTPTPARIFFISVSLFAAGGLVLALYAVERQVQELEGELAGLNRSIIEDEQALHVLKAEWSLLNNPGRLRDLSTRLLGMEPVQPSQMSSLSDLPMRPVASAPVYGVPLTTNLKHGPKEKGFSQ